MSRNYYNRYEDYITDGKFRIVPGIEIPIKGSDKYMQYKRGKDRLDKISQEYYNSPYFNWLILQANPQFGGLENNIYDGAILIIPFPLLPSLQDYKAALENHFYYYGR